MRRAKSFKHGRTALALIVCGVVYAIGGSHIALRSAGVELSAAQAVALRFPQDWDDASPALVLPAEVNSIAASTEESAQLALLSPQPMLSQPAAPAVQPAPQAVVQTAALEEVKTAPASDVIAHPKRPVAAVASTRPTKPNVAPVHRSPNRPGYMLDDAQIASIKKRLHLTPQQQAMWPAVEAALRNIGYAKAQEARRRGNPSGTQTAAIDPDSAEVQGLKSAAVPLIMSFNDEQKEEVRNLAHVMGLDQLASQF